MLKLSAAYGAKWTSAFGHRELRCNERMWSPAGESHAPDDSFFGVVDKADGSSFVLRIERLDEPGVADEDIEDGLTGPLHVPPLNAERQGACRLDVSGLEFKGARLAISNRRFGPQWLQVMFSREGEVVTIMQFTWPRAAAGDDPSLPIKHQALLDGLSL
jgi:hypothetical protein